jgi:riboflavin kinase
LHEGEGIIIVPEKGFREGKCFKALVNEKVEGAVVLPNVPDYPLDLLEILAPVNLRETLELTEGKEVKVTIKLE